MQTGRAEWKADSSVLLTVVMKTQRYNLLQQVVNYANIMQWSSIRY